MKRAIASGVVGALLFVGCGKTDSGWHHAGGGVGKPDATPVVVDDYDVNTWLPDEPLAARCFDVRLELKVRKPDKQHTYAAFVATIVNRDMVPVTLVETGDGSDGGRRTPTIAWTTRLTAGKASEPSEGGRCGNINRIHEQEIFELGPGESRELGWLGEPHVGAGRYDVKLVYENDPKMKLSWQLIGPKDAGAPVLQKIRRSTPCKVESNTLNVALPLTG